MDVITEVHQETHIAIDRLCEALLVPRSTYYFRQENQKNKSSKLVEKIVPRNALSFNEKQQVITLLHSEKFIDKTPYAAFNTLLDEGEYLCSPRTMYRILGAVGENKDRRKQRSHRDAIKPELMATKPNEVWSWDITKLRSDRKWNYFYLYVIIDIYSRCVVGWMVADRECKILARRLIQKSALKQSIKPGQLTLHSDNGPSMTSHTVSQLLNNIGVFKTHNRPYVSDDNPFSESQFKTMKYSPEFPGKFTSLEEAEIFLRRFFVWYNKEHYHSNIVWLTPESVHYGLGETILAKRHEAMMKAYFKNPLRFNYQAPKLKVLPSAVYINPPEKIDCSALQKEVCMA
jgi:putative transposase